MTKIIQADRCVMVDYTPASPVLVGAIIEQGAYPMVAHKAIAANVKGALSAGGGVYEIAVAQGATITAGGKVYWDAQADGVTTDSTKTQFGTAISGGTGKVLVFHDPAAALYPSILSLTVPAAGTTLVIVYSEPVTSASGGEQTGWTLTASGGAVTASSGTGTGTATHTLTLSRTIAASETVTASYDSGPGDLTYGAGLNFGSVTNRAVTNSSTQ